MSKHTPGPWAVSKNDLFVFGKKQGNGLEPIGFIYGPACAEHSEYGQRCIADVHLCAAAPAMLQALEDLLEAADALRQTCEVIRGSHPEENDTHTHEQWAEELLTEKSNAVRAVIRAARGEA